MNIDIFSKLKKMMLKKYDKDYLVITKHGIFYNNKKIDEIDSNVFLYFTNTFGSKEVYIIMKDNAEFEIEETENEVIIVI